MKFLPDVYLQTIFHHISFNGKCPLPNSSEDVKKIIGNLHVRHLGKLPYFRP